MAHACHQEPTGTFQPVHSISSLAIQPVSVTFDPRKLLENWKKRGSRVRGSALGEVEASVKTARKSSCWKRQKSRLEYARLRFNSVAINNDAKISDVYNTKARNIILVGSG